MRRARPARMIVEAIRSRQYGEVVGRILQLLAEEVGKGSLGLVRTAYAHVVGGHQRVVRRKEVVLLQFGVIDYFGSLQIVFPIIGAACYQMPLVALDQRKPGRRIQLQAIQATKEGTIMQPPFSVRRVNHDAGVDGIHCCRFIRPDYTSHLLPGTFGRSRFGQPYIRRFPTEGRNAEIKSVSVLIRNDVGRPDVGSPLPSRMSVHPLDGFARNLGECPSEELPMHQVLRTAHLNVAQGYALFFGLLAVFTIDGVGGVHIIIVANLPTRRVVNVVRSPLTVVLHRRDMMIIVAPGIGRSSRYKSRLRTTH